MKLFAEKYYSKALVIGAGSGRDIASCVLVTERLRQVGVEVDLAGFLSPWALHMFDEVLEKPVNELTGKTSKKFIPSREGVSLDSYFEPTLYTLNREFDLGVGSFYLFSLQYGTERLGHELERLVKKNAYDAVIAVDIGGDILARKKDYPWLLTPIVDFSCLSVLAGLHSGIDSYLTIVAPGTDGELPSQNLQEILSEFQREGLVLGFEEQTRGSSHYKVYERVNREINARTGSRSNTFRLIERVLSSSNSSIFESREKKVSIKERKWNLSFPVDLWPSLAKGVYHLDLKGVHSMREAGLSYKSVFEAFTELKALGAGGTELDLSFVTETIDDRGCHDIVFLLTPPDRIEESVRKEILTYGIQLTARGDIPCSVLLAKDRSAVEIPSNLSIQEKENWGPEVLFIQIA
ncbi:MAG: DUF1152 domain-containing protein [Deltaproteobacteria bacterium]|nr:DUF1152 domain-containing protein [Deltaproteobacteria bacterium]